MKDDKKQFFFVSLCLLVGLVIVIVLYTFTLHQNRFNQIQAIDSDYEEITSKSGIKDLSETEEEVAEEVELEEVEEISPEDIVSLTIDWLDDPEEVDISELDLEVPEYFEFVNAYKVGTVDGSDFDGKDFYLIEEKYVFAKRHYRVIDDRGGRGLVLLANISNDVAEQSEDTYEITNQYIIPELEMPEELFVTVDEEDLVFEMETFSPAAMFDDFVEDSRSYAYSDFGADANESLVHDVYGTLYQNENGGYFVVEVPDHTTKIYRLAYPISIGEDDVMGFAISTFDISLETEDGSVIQGEYTPERPWVCPPKLYDVHEGIEGQLTEVASQDDVVFYKQANDADDIVREIYDALYNTDDYRTFLENNPVLFFEDDLGRWIRIRKTEYYPALETECSYINSAI